MEKYVQARLKSIKFMRPGQTLDQFIIGGRIVLASNFLRGVKRCILFSFIFLKSLFAFAQLPANFNLIPNPSFEIGYRSIDSFNDTSFNDNNTCWIKANAERNVIWKDTFITGVQIARTGRCAAWMTIHTSPYWYPPFQWQDTLLGTFRTYQQTNLIEPLIAGQTYYFTMYVGYIKHATMHSNADILTNLGVYFSDTQIRDYSNLGRINVTPQIRFDYWDMPYLDSFVYLKLSDTFTATGGEQYMVIGNFDHYSQLNVTYISPHTISNGSFTGYFVYPFIDDISLVRDTNNIINLSQFSLGNDTVLCGDSLVIGGEDHFFSYLWNTGDTNRFLTVRDTGTYWCTVDFGCSNYTDTIYIGAPPPLAPFSIPDSSVCPGMSYAIHAPPGYGYLWNDLSTDDSLEISTPGSYWLRISDGCATFTDSFTVTNRDTPLVAFSIPDTAMCIGSPFTVRGPAGQFAYRWQNGSAADSLRITAPGQYWLETSNYCGSTLADTFVVTDADAPSFPFMLPDSSLCPGESYVVQEAPRGRHAYLWSDGSTADTLVVNTPGKHWLRISNICGSGRTDTFNVRDKHTPIPFFDITDTAICPGTSLMVTVPVTLPPGAIEYQWSNGDATDFIVISNADLYWVTLTDECGISFSDTFRVSIADTTLPDFAFADTVVCSGKPLTVTGPAGDFTYLWSNSQTTRSTTVQTAGIYSLTITHRCGNSRSTSFEVTETSDPSWTELSASYSICTGDTVTLEATPGFGSYQWNTGDTTNSIRTSSEGSYSVTAKGQCDQHTSSTTVIVQDPPESFSFGNDTAICAGEVFILSAPAGFAYQWNTGNTQSTQSVSEAGIYTCVVSNDCGSESASITVSMIQPPQPPLVITGATDLCRSGTMQPVTLTTATEGFNLRWNTGATTPQISVSTPGTYILTAYNDCGSITDSVYVRGCKGIIGFPTAFSPNDDGKNDIFRPVLQDAGLIAEYHLQVFNRWGNIVFETNDPAVGWDGHIAGQAASSATYFWQCRVKDVQGRERVEKGDVILVR